MYVLQHEVADYEIDGLIFTIPSPGDVGDGERYVFQPQL